MNRGLKSYTKQLTQEIGSAKACVNINENDANMHIVLPLVKTIAKTSILYSASERTITVKDAISGEFIEYTYSGNKIISFKDMGGRTTSVTYNGKRTTVTDFLGNKSFVIFEKNNFPLYEIDNGFNIVRYEFDKNSKKLISISDPIQARNKDNSIFDCSLRSFTREGIGLLETPFTDEIFNGVIGETVSTITGTGKLTKEINIKYRTHSQL